MLHPMQTMLYPLQNMLHSLRAIGHEILRISRFLTDNRHLIANIHPYANEKQHNWHYHCHMPTDNIS
jgi:hypothetical protein